MSVKRYIAKQFAAPKGFGGRVISLIMNRQNRPLYDETIRLLMLSDAELVLDIGCGNGYVLNLLARQHDATFTGIDTSENVIKSAARRNRRYIKSQKMRFHCQNVSAMSFPDGSFSKAYSINTVYFWNCLDTAMREIGRVLKPGGLFINTLYSNETLSRFSHTQFGYTRYEPEQLIRSGKGAGFRVEAVPVLYGAAHCYVYRKPADGVL